MNGNGVCMNGWGVLNVYLLSSFKQYFLSNYKGSF